MSTAEKHEMLDMERGGPKWQDHTEFVTHRGSASEFAPMERHCANAYEPGFKANVVVSEIRCWFQYSRCMAVNAGIGLYQWFKSSKGKRFLSSLSVAFAVLILVGIVLLLADAFQGSQLDPGHTVEDSTQGANVNVPTDQRLASAELIDYAQHWMQASPHRICRYYHSHELLVYRNSPKSSDLTFAWKARISSRNYDTWWTAESSMVHWKEISPKYCNQSGSYVKARLFNQILLEYLSDNPDFKSEVYPTPGPTVITMDLEMETTHCIQQELLQKLPLAEINDTFTSKIRKSFHKPSCVTDNKSHQ